MTEREGEKREGGKEDIFSNGEVRSQELGWVLPSPIS